MSIYEDMGAVDQLADEMLADIEKERAQFSYVRKQIQEHTDGYLQDTLLAILDLIPQR